MKTLEYIENYNAYQPYMLLNFNLSFEKDIAHDDICRTVIEVVEEVNIARYVDFTNRKTHGYDGVMMFKLIMLAMADRGYVSTRKLSKLCKTDIRYMFIAQNQKPSHQAFQRFIHDDLTMPIEDIFYEINKYIESKISINTDVLCIDGTKYEANANKNTFVWRANTIRNRTKRWKKVILCLKKINKYFAEQNIALNYSLLKEPSIEYMLAVADGIERYMKDYNIEFVHGKGKRKSDIQRLYDELKEHAIKLWEYAIHMELLGNRNSFSKTDPDATFMHMKYDYYNHTNVFKPIHCSAIPNEMMEIELFGDEKNYQMGKIELAENGTLFLDEIEYMSLECQSKLFEFLNSKILHQRKRDVRIIASTQTDLLYRVNQQLFKGELYYKLNVMNIVIPPLRQRRDDIMPLVSYYLNKYSKILRKEITGIEKECSEVLVNYNWLGNIRELESTMEHLINISKTKILLFNDLPADIVTSYMTQKYTSGQTNQIKSPEVVEYGEIIRLLKQEHGHMKTVAKLLEMPLSTLYRKCNKYNIEPKQYKAW